MAGFTQFTLSIDGHSMVVTAVDAIPVKPSTPVKAVTMDAGQRLVVLVYPDTDTSQSAAQAGGMFWIRSMMTQSNFMMGSSRYPLTKAVLNYGSANVTSLPTTEPDEINHNQVSVHADDMLALVCT